MKSQSAGFSLIELLIVIAILGIIVGIAVPQYNQYRRRANRAEARTTLVEAAQIAEREFVRTNSYDDAAIPAESPHRLYRIDYDSDVTEFVISAVPQGAQAGDECGTFTINQAGVRGAAQAGCW